jgi:phage terminase large subunit-like protein
VTTGPRVSRTIARARRLATRDGWPARWVRTESDAQAVLDHGCYFDVEAAARFLVFGERFCRHSKGQWARQPFAAMPWQREHWFGPLFGWKRADGTRRYRRGGVWIPKKNGKTSCASVITLYLLVADREPGAEVYSGANDKDQSGLIYRECAAMVRQSPALASRLHPIDSRKTIAYERMAAFYKALSADVPAKEGINAHGVIIDELHALQDRGLWSTLAYAGAARRQPLLLSISTAGIYDPASIGWEQYQYATHVLDGTRDDWSFFALVYEAPPKANWRRRAVWRAANPSYGVTVRADQFEEHAREAAASLDKQNDFQRYRLNIWVQQATRAIDLRVWDENHRHALTADGTNTPNNPSDGRAWYGGLDLGGTSDLSAWVRVASCPHDPKAIDVRAQFWLPEAVIGPASRHRNKTLYKQWADQGVLTLTPGNVADEPAIEAAILADAGAVRLVASRIDRLFQGLRLASNLTAEGVVMAAMGQGFLSMAAPTKTFFDLLEGRRFHHGGDPVLRWMADNVVTRSDSAGNRKIDKARSPQKVDGIVAAVMAIAGWISVDTDPEYQLVIVGPGA